MIVVCGGGGDGGGFYGGQNAGLDSYPMVPMYIYGVGFFVSTAGTFF